MRSSYVEGGPFRFGLDSILRSSARRGIVLAPRRRRHLLTFVRGSGVCDGCCSRIILLLRAKLHVSRFYKLAARVSVRGEVLGVSRRLLGSDRVNCCVRAPGAGGKGQRLPLARHTCRTVREVLGGEKGTRPLVMNNCDGFLFLGHRNLPGITKGCRNVIQKLVGGCGGCRASGLPGVAPRSFQRACYAGVTGEKVGPGALRCLVKRTGVAVALNCCTRNAFRSTGTRLRELTYWCQDLCLLLVCCF